MVLSNKKLKHKIRSELAESKLTPSQIPNPNSFKSFLDSVTQKPRLSKREKRRGNFTDSNKENEEGGLELEVVNKKKKKRKREVEDGEKIVSENGSLEVKKLKSKKVSKKKKKYKKKNKKVGDKEVEEKGVEIDNEVQSVVETVQDIDSQVDVDVSTKVYVGGIPYYSNEEDICSFFESCGTITELDCMTFPDTGKFRGIAIITFKTDEAAKRALALDGADMGGLFLKIQRCKTTTEKKVSDFSPAIVEGYNRVYVGNLSWDIKEEDLRSFFADCSISSIRFGEDKETKEFRGYAHVDFNDTLSVTMALKLDQKILCGRPVRISCAVPAKKAQSHAKFVPTSKPVDTIEVNATDADTGTVSGKLRRRTCYNCGEKGHITSSCPKTNAADSIKSLPTLKKDENVKAIADNADRISHTKFVPTIKNEDTIEVNATNADTGTVSGKIRRRTCYNCGEKGHITSSCPKTNAADSIESLPTLKKDENVKAVANNVEPVPDNVEIISIKRKIKTECYECGEKNHFTSSCPNKQPADSMKFAPTSRTAHNETNTYHSGGFNNDNVQATSINVETTNISGKIRRRTCYECGEKGHLSSSCPKKQATDSVVPVAS